MNLTDQQKIFLLLIDQRTDVDWTTGELKSFWMPPCGLKTNKIDALDGEVSVDGSGVARTLKALERRGLTKGMRFDYSYRITEDGHKAAQELLADRDEIERLSKYVSRN